jgi:hypothetical protein
VRIFFVIAALALVAVAGGRAGSTATAPHIWLGGPNVVLGSGFPAGKVTVSAWVKGKTAVQAAQASKAGRFAARFDSPIRVAGCQVAVVTAVGRGRARAVLSLRGSSRDCPQPIDP